MDLDVRQYLVGSLLQCVLEVVQCILLLCSEKANVLLEGVDVALQSSDPPPHRLVLGTPWTCVYKGHVDKQCNLM